MGTPARLLQCSRHHQSNMASSLNTLICVALLALLTVAEATKTGQCWSDKAAGIHCCAGGKQLSNGNNVGPDGEVFIQEDKLMEATAKLTRCANSCMHLEGHAKGKPTGITQSITQFYSDKKTPKCWCEFGEPKLDDTNDKYKTCMFRRKKQTKPAAEAAPAGKQ